MVSIRLRRSIEPYLGTISIAYLLPASLHSSGPLLTSFSRTGRQDDGKIKRHAE